MKLITADIAIYHPAPDLREQGVVFFSYLTIKNSTGLPMIESCAVLYYTLYIVMYKGLF